MFFNVDSLLTDDLVNLRAIFIANGADLRFVGGCVRDLLGGKQPKDIDLCTDATPDEQVEIYKQHNIRYIETGIDHGTITIVLNDHVYEITSLRLDVATDGRRATVAYTKDWYADAARRDFTINSMSLTFDGLLIDPFNGYDDLKKGIVKFVGDANQRIKEDYLRILRWFRFRGRYEDPNSISYVNHPNSKDVMNNCHGLSQISNERIWSEIKQILSGLHGPTMMLELHRHNCSQPIGLPQEIDYICLGTELHSRVKNPIIILTSLYTTATVWNALKRWKASNEEWVFWEWYSKYQTRKNNYFYMLAVNGYKRDWVLELAAAQNCDPFDLAVLEDWPIPVFPVNGFDLINRGVKPGPLYRVILNQLKESWAKSGYTATKEQLLEEVDEAMI